MAFHLILDESRAFLNPAPDATASRSDAQRAVERLGADYLRWSRIGIGVVAFFGALIGAAGTTLLSDAFSPAQPLAVRVFAGAVGLALLVVLALSVWLLIRLASSGRLLVRSLAAWLAGPYRFGAMAPSWAGWLHTRLLMFRPAVFVRIAAASCAALFGAYATYALLATIAAPSSSVVMYGCWAAVAFATSIVLFSGSMRLVGGRAEADRVWRTVRDGSMG